jgi:hypothetical protein
VSVLITFAEQLHAEEWAVISFFSGSGGTLHKDVHLQSVVCSSAICNFERFEVEHGNRLYLERQTLLMPQCRPAAWLRARPHGAHGTVLAEHCSFCNGLRWMGWKPIQTLP